MQKSKSVRRTVPRSHYLRLWPGFFLVSIILVYGSALGQSAGCNFDRAKPNIKSARTNFKALNYKCAEEELNLLLKDTAINLEDKANAHILMAAVYYALLKNDTDMRGRVIDQFKEAFRTYREWRGELDIKSSEFSDLMGEARRQVDSTGTAQPQAPPSVPATTAVSKDKIAKPKGSGKSAPWIITGVTAAAGAMFFVSSSRANTKWNDYVGSGGQSSFYDSYKSANNLKKISGGVTIGAAVVSGYLWWKYFGSTGEYQGARAGDEAGNGLAVGINPAGLSLTYRF